MESRIKIVMTALILLMTFLASASYSRIINVNATDNNVFVPATVNAVVGDTIQWTRVGSGSHTTTCDGSPLTSRPAGADPWNSLLNSQVPTFRYVIRVAGLYNYICEPHIPSMVGVINAATSSITQLTGTITDYGLSQNYPNPFNPSTRIKFSIPNSSKVLLTVYNNVGQEITELINEQLNAGTYEVDWNAVNFTSGVYYYKIQAENYIDTKKMFLIK